MQLSSALHSLPNFYFYLYWDLDLLLSCGAPIYSYTDKCARSYSWDHASYRKAQNQTIIWERFPAVTRNNLFKEKAALGTRSARTKVEKGRPSLMGDSNFRYLTPTKLAEEMYSNIRLCMCRSGYNTHPQDLIIQS